ncbi:RimJ/RimL family protein N-acetyltransferase [Pedobacter cryoconitis]|uniref:RimJ/RimL family protein N-acetyltransferase n=1 Tax=Pedobacter cryoconitis TaxID=188932 RepID=A0A7W8ZRN1_9SPHI|nr:GNAT family N-acetyltransferase [Pedobacter cryoconitis]MBB5638760.1 RimJ/RimL family protein N-acetyltransferase [Pedobacter cryoconitis]MBB6270230.1 RimJ/RimL family protein N-acetyltransferase [Pedobacter cryoconitis]
MKVFAETDRLILREILLSDKDGMYELDNDPLVHKYLGNQPVSSITQTEEAIAFIRKQYIDNGTGRLAVIKKDTAEFIGWAGLKLVRGSYNNHTNYYEVGYRFIQRFWGKGYATEAAQASLDYGFDGLKLHEIYAMADTGNTASKIVLEKIGLRYIEKFDLDGDEHDWFKITREEWENRKL